MSRLSEIRREKQTDTRSRQPTQEPLEQGTIRNVAVYSRPFNGKYLNQNVRVIATGDIAGMSPALQVVDEQGHIDWVPSEDVVVTQPRLLPNQMTQRSRARQESFQS